MTPEQIDRVFGRGRLKMATGEHVEVFREAVAPGERRRYTKRFLTTREGDFGQWTEREWRILARLIGHGIACVPDVVQFDRGRVDGMQLVQTYDAGVTVDQWATLLPVTRDGCVYGHVFEDCAHWWALAHHCLLALHVIHPLELVHLDIKGDNVCIPYAPASFDPDSFDLRLRPLFAQLALIDFAFALVSREALTAPLPIGWQKDYDYQSPRLLAALEAGRAGELRLTRELDWRCDMYSLAAMLKRYLPDESLVLQPARAGGWSIEHYGAAKALILRLRDSHDGGLSAQRPHAGLLEITGARLREEGLAQSLERGWTLAREASVSCASASPLTPVTRLALPQVVRSGRTTAVTVVTGAQDSQAEAPARMPDPPRAAQLPHSRHARGPVALAALVATCAVGAGLWYLDDRSRPLSSEIQALGEPIKGAASKAADAMRRLVPRNKDAQEIGAVAGQAPSGLSATREDLAALAPSPAPAAVQSIPLAPTPAASPARSEPPSGSTAALQQAPAAGLASTANVASAPAVPPTQAPREAAASPLVQQRLAQAQASAPGTGKSWTIPWAKHASAQSRPGAKLSHAQAAKAPTAPQPVQTRASTQAGRAHAWWASLQPPAWLHSGTGPGQPPGAKTHPPSTAVVGSLTEALSAESASAPTSTTAPGTELAQPSPQPAPPAATAATRAAEPTPAHADASAPRAQRPDATARANEGRSATGPAASKQPSRSGPSGAPVEDRSITAAVTPKQPSRGGPSAAPVEDRSEALTLALAQTPTAPEPSNAATAADRNTQDDFAAQGRRTLVDTVPRVARQAEPEVARVLWMAASAYRPMQERAVADAARLTRIAGDASLLTRATEPGEARRLSDQAHAALASRRNAVEAFNLQLRAFGANPRDPEVAGYLALLYLKLTPPQPDMARQVALVALATHAPQLHSPRMEDWNTFAVASALSGREVDARNAWFVTLAVSGSVEQTCMAALDALANYGERLRRPVEAVLYRIHAQGRGYDSPRCAWSPTWSGLSRLP